MKSVSLTFASLLLVLILSAGPALSQSEKEATTAQVVAAMTGLTKNQSLILHFEATMGGKPIGFSSTSLSPAGGGRSDSCRYQSEAVFSLGNGARIEGWATAKLNKSFEPTEVELRREVTAPNGQRKSTFDRAEILDKEVLLTRETDGGALQRQTEFAYNRLSQLIMQTAQNKTNAGTPLADQVTTYRHDSLGRQTRTVYPDSSDHADPLNCTDCVRMTFDLVGRMTQRIDQRGLTAVFAYDDRDLLLTRTTGTDRDTFDYDGVGRMTLAQRGTTGDPDAVSNTVLAYTDLGDLDFETQTITGGTARTVAFDCDQAGNRIQLTYPGGDMLAYTPTALNQVDTVNVNGVPFVDYDYQGRLLDKRRTITTDPGGNSAYEYDIGYDALRLEVTIQMADGPFNRWTGCGIVLCGEFRQKTARGALVERQDKGRASRVFPDESLPAYSSAGVSGGTRIPMLFWPKKGRDMRLWHRNWKGPFARCVCHVPRNGALLGPQKGMMSSG